MLSLKRLAVLAAALVLAACAGAAAPTPGAGPNPTALALGGAPATAGSGTYYNVSAIQLSDMLKHKDFTLVNVHVPYAGEIAGTDSFIPFQALGSQRVTDYPADKEAKLLVYCRSGYMSAIVAGELARAGYTNVWNLAGGMDGWEAAGFTLLRH